MNKSPDTLTTDNLKRYFAQLIKTHLWSTVRIDLMEYESYGCPIFFLEHIFRSIFMNALAIYCIEITRIISVTG
ncbi:hypothetical protein CTM67_12080 [Photobacterium phosphoreum]|nr:hypothetical protein CTM67_12080 [Photobacterium phosphoreum]